MQRSAIDSHGSPCGAMAMGMLIVAASAWTFPPYEASASYRTDHFCQRPVTYHGLCLGV
jgi:hypothetical protein